MKMCIAVDSQTVISANPLRYKKIKILFLSHTANLWGAERCLLDLLKGINRDKYDLLVVIPQNGLLCDKLNQLGIRTLVYPIQRLVAFDKEYSRWHFKKVFFGLPMRTRYLTKLIKEENVDVVYTNTITPFDGAIAAKIKNIPHIWHIHELLNGNFSLKPYLPKALIRILVDLLSSKIIAVSNAVVRRQKEKKTRVIYNGINFKEDPYNETRDLRSELILDRDTKIVALAGTYAEAKGQRDFIEAAGIVSRLFKNVSFVLIGKGNIEFLDKLKVKAQALGLDGRVHFLNYRQDLSEFYESIDILALASWSEGFSRVLIEAMAAGKPVVATRCGGPEEIVVDGQNGFLVPVKSPKDIAVAIVKLLSNPELAENMGRLGQERARQLFSLERYVSDIENVIDEVVSKR